MASHERCPKCRSRNITGRGFDMGDGDELQERYCYDCKHDESRMRSAGGVSWYVPAPEQEPHRSLTATGIEKTLLDEIYASLDDDAPRSIYADWLIEQGDPLGTFIALQLARAKQRDPKVSAEEQALLDKHWGAWIGNPSALIRSQAVELERGFWSACDRFNPTARSIEQLPEALTERSWSTVRRIGVTQRSALAHLALFDPPLAIEELVLAFDVSRDPPALVFPQLPRLRTIAVHCHGEFAPRWIERAAAAGLRSVRIVSQPHIDEVKAMFARARSLQMDSFVLELKGVIAFADRSDDGLRIRRIDSSNFRFVRAWIDLLGDYVGPDVKVTLPSITAALAEEAESHRLRLVAHAASFAAKPK